jgi:hypothetical protein
MEKKLEIKGAYERIEDKEALSELHKTVEEVLTGEWCAILTAFELCRDRMLSALVESQPFTFRPKVQLDPAGTAFTFSGTKRQGLRES